MSLPHFAVCGCCVNQCAFIPAFLVFWVLFGVCSALLDLFVYLDCLPGLYPCLSLCLWMLIMIFKMNYPPCIFCTWIQNPHFPLFLAGLWHLLVQWRDWNIYFFLKATCTTSSNINDVFALQTAVLLNIQQIQSNISTHSRSRPSDESKSNIYFS